MPLNSPINNTDSKDPGILFVVATPIGNRKDITLRAIETLGQVDLVAAEDTRKTGLFLLSHEIKANLISYHEYNERKRTPYLINKIKSGLSIALVSNAGTPSVSDPGYHLITEAILNKIRVVPIPGASAPITALSAAGISGGSFIFMGFPPRNKTKRKKMLETFLEEEKTIVFYESPKRVTTFLEEIKERLGNRDTVISREMTKLYEEFIRGNLSEVITNLKDRPSVKGEFTILINGSKEKKKICDEDLLKEVKARMDRGDSGVLEIAKEISRKYHLKKSMVYDMALKIKEDQD